MDTVQHDNNRVILHLSLIKDIGPATVFKLLRHAYLQKYPDVGHVEWIELIERHHELSLQTLYDYSVGDFLRGVGLSDRIASTLAKGLADVTMVEREVSLAQQHDVAIMTVLDADYPEILKQIYSPPLVLYCKGAPFNGVAKRMGIVGSRKATDYATRVMKKLIPGLIEQDWHIVSGGAEGVDTVAHREALEAGGRTLAVLGSGLLVPYPLSNVQLFDTIVDKNGMVLSPFPLMTPPDRGNFPARNRIISGLSLGCIIVQAAAKSGALITAQCALEQGRLVFAVPGPIHEELSAGCHHLIQEGAKLVNHVNDILEEFGEYKQVAIQPARRLERNELLPQHTPANPILAHLVHPASLDELLEKTGFEATVLQDCLFALQLEGKVRQNFAGTWELVEGW